MLHYARSDTHYLLFIYDNLRNALLDRSASRAQSRAQTPNLNAEGHASNRSTPEGDPKLALVREVLSRSEETALRVYEREGYDVEGLGPGGWDTLARKWNRGALMASERMSPKARIYRRVHAWRDRVAREEDESTGYVRLAYVTGARQANEQSIAVISYRTVHCSCLPNNRQSIWLRFWECSTM